MSASSSGRGGRDPRDADVAARAIRLLYRRVPGGRLLLEAVDRVALAYLERRYVVIGRSHGWSFGMAGGSTQPQTKVN